MKDQDLIILVIILVMLFFLFRDKLGFGCKKCREGMWVNEANNQKYTIPCAATL